MAAYRLGMTYSYLPVHWDQLEGPTLGKEYGRTLFFISDYLFQNLFETQNQLMSR